MNNGADHEILKRVESKVDRIDRTLRGNGEIGIVTRLDRLEQWRRRRGVVLGWIVPAILGVVGGLVAAWAKK